MEQNTEIRSKVAAMDEDAKRQLLETDFDFIAIKRFDYSMKLLFERYPDNVPDPVIAQALMISEVELEKRYQTIVAKLRDMMGA